LTMLNEVRDFAQAVADAIAGVIGVEVAMVDENLLTVVGSGRYARHIGRVLRPDSISAKVLAQGKTLIVHAPPSDHLCQDCSQKATCTDAADIITPLSIGGQLAGCVLLVACTSEQRDRLIGDTQRWVDFAEKMADLISRAFNEKQQADEARALAMQFDTVINAVSEGILTLDSRGTILHASQSAERLLEVSTGDLVSRSISFVFPQIGLDFLNRPRNADFETFSMFNNEKAYWLGAIKPIGGPAIPNGYVVTFRGIEEIPKLVANYIGRERQVTFRDILGSSASMSRVKQIAASIAGADSTVLIQGESGTGKELFARAIHFESPRRKGPFVALNCAAIPEPVLESELFGYEEGAFTGAKRGGKPGKFELAHGGTLFLDEIGDMPIHLQAKILRAIQERMVDRLGAGKPKPVDIRIIASTNRDLEQMAVSGGFRLDLYYRLAVIPIVIPPLREHREDIPEYVDHFTREYSQALGKKVEGIDPAAMDALMKYAWPGNIRELANALEYAVNLVDGPMIDLSRLPPQIAAATSKAAQAPGLTRPRRRITRDDLEKALLVYGRSTKAREAMAASFGISRATLYRRLKEYGLRGRPLTHPGPPLSVSDPSDTHSD